MVSYKINSDITLLNSLAIFIFFGIFVLYKEVMNKKFLFAFIVICFGAIYRLMPHPHNFTPVGAMALIGGMYLGRKKLALIIPVVILFLSDFILNNTINRIFFEEQTGLIVWSEYMTYNYIAILLTVFIGFALTKSSTFNKIIGGSLATSIVFFVVTNFGSWLTMPFYTKDFAGLTSSYAAGVPFFANTLMSDALFIGLFVLSIEFAFKYATNSKTQSIGA